MAATKVTKFWAVCLAVLGKLLASLGVSAAASAARREAAMHGDGARTTSDAARDAAPDRDPVPSCGQVGSGRRMLGDCAQLPPTIKQRIRAEAHGASPTLRTRLAAGVEPLHTVPAMAALHTGTDADEIPTVLPAAHRRAHADCAA
ncbi:DUF6344 domain-containing protein [Streptomyces sp. NPDC050636]|uniref:DUF6344 domain-containing protein n=1 Tax=Streptomyces sp. NPDC050636 TaxID=3154510 RepID=UPI00343971AF